MKVIAKILKTYKVTTGATVFVFAMSGCAARENASLTRARFEVQSAQQNSQINQYAPTVLRDAGNAYDRAQREWLKTSDRDETEHLVYLTEQTLQIAREETRRKMGQESAQLNRDLSRLAAGDLRADRDSEHARANINSLVAESYRQRSDENQRLIADLDKKVEALRSKETERGLELTLSESVLYESNSSKLKSGAVLSLSPLTDFLKRNPTRSISIEGHTDSRGSEEHNNTLSQARAESVRNLLIEQGIASDRISAKGMGEAYPLSTNDSEAGRLQNRRVQVIIS